MVSNETFCSKIESVIFQDPGNRGIKGAFVPGVLYESSQAILSKSKYMPSYILTGFCCKGYNCETDGPLGSSVLCSVLRSLYYDTSILCDSTPERAVKAALNGNPILIENNYKNILKKNISFIISVERPGRTFKNEDYRTMKAFDISDRTCDLDKLFPNNIDNFITKYLTVSIGDGGNEVGTGNILNYVMENVPMGRDICTISTCDYLIMSGVSNWGALGLAAALAIVSNNREAGRTFIETCNKQNELLKKMIEAGSYDGVSGQCIMAVDGMMFDQEHAQVNEAFISIIKEKYRI